MINGINNITCNFFGGANYAFGFIVNNVNGHKFFFNYFLAIHHYHITFIYFGAEIG